MYQNLFKIFVRICDALRNLVPFLQFKKHEIMHGRVLLLVKLQAKSYNFTESNTAPLVLFTFLNCINGTKSRKAFHKRLDESVASQFFPFSVSQYWIVAAAFWKGLKGNLSLKRVNKFMIIVMNENNISKLKRIQRISSNKSNITLQSLYFAWFLLLVSIY